MKKKYTKIYNIHYNSNQSGPAEFLIDFNEFSWSKDVPAGPMHLNTKVVKAIKEISGLDIVSCSFDIIYLD